MEDSSGGRSGREAAPPATVSVVILVTVAAYIVAASIAVWAIPGPERTVFDLGFFFGAKIARLSQGLGLGDGTRMPFVPYFLWGVSSLGGGLLATTAVKNLLVQAPLAWVLVRMVRASRRQAAACALAGFVLTFPQLVRHAFSLVPEEGYLVSLLALLFFGLLRAGEEKGAGFVSGLALAGAAAFLVKSSMVLVVPVVALLLGWRARSRTVALVCAGAVAAAALGWGLVNLRNTGHFSVGTSLDGYNFWKGNNSHVLGVFPSRSLDAVGWAAPAQRPGESEWDWNARCYREGIRFNLDHPREAMKILLLRVYQVFLAVTAEDSPRWGAARAPLKVVGIAYMAVFRLLLAGGLVVAVRAVWRGRLAAARGETFEVSLAFLVFVAGFVFPYLVAWGVERRLMPLVVPVVLYAWWANEKGLWRTRAESGGAA